VIEQPAPDKVLAPVDPFYITLPMPVEVENEAGETVIRYLDIVSVYPKNTPYVPPLPPPPTPPPPHNVSGSFSILKHDAIDPAIVLSDAQFKVWRPAGPEDTVVDILLCDGINYAVVPVQVDGKDLILTTDVYGRAFSPELPCGPYFLQEIQPPRGFLPLDSAVSLTVVPGVVAEAPLIDIPNERNGILPETGGIGTAPVILAGTVMALGALALLLRKQRRSP